MSCNSCLIWQVFFQLLLSLGDGGEGKYETNINFLLEDYGIMVNSDSVVRTSYYKYFHPKVSLEPVSYQFKSSQAGHWIELWTQKSSSGFIIILITVQQLQVILSWSFWNYSSIKVSRTITTPFDWLKVFRLQRSSEYLTFDQESYNLKNNLNTWICISLAFGIV